MHLGDFFPVSEPHQMTSSRSSGKKGKKEKTTWNPKMLWNSKKSHINRRRKEEEISALS